MTPNPRRLDLTVYPYQFDLAPRYSDLDPQMHLNNVRLADYYQEGRVLFYRALQRDFGFEADGESRTLVAHLSIDYLAEVRYPQGVKLGIGVTRIGRSSYSLGLALFQSAQCVGLAVTVMVRTSAQGPIPLPPQLRDILQQKLLPEDARA